MLLESKQMNKNDDLKNYESTILKDDPKNILNNQ